MENEVQTESRRPEQNVLLALVLRVQMFLRELLVWPLNKNGAFLLWSFFFLEFTYKARNRKSLTCMTFHPIQPLNGVK